MFSRFDREKKQNTEILDVLGKAHISPVLTAHPTEVQRRSVLDAEKKISEILKERNGELIVGIEEAINVVIKMFMVKVVLIGEEEIIVIKKRELNKKIVKSNLLISKKLKIFWKKKKVILAKLKTNILVN